MVDFVELSNKPTNSVRTIKELLVEFVPQTFKRYFQNFLLKANQQFVEILTTSYIFQSHSIYNMWQSRAINFEALRPIKAY